MDQTEELDVPMTPLQATVALSSFAIFIVLFSVWFYALQKKATENRLARETVTPSKTSPTEEVANTKPKTN